MDHLRVIATLPSGKTVEYITTDVTDAKFIRDAFRLVLLDRNLEEPYRSLLGPRVVQRREVEVDFDEG